MINSALNTSFQSDDNELFVDPGFIHHRKIESVLGREGTAIIYNEIAKIPAQVPEWQKEVSISISYSRVLLQYCKIIDVKTIEENILDRKGQIICSIQKFLPTDSIYVSGRATCQLEMMCNCSKKIELQFSTNRITSETLKSGLTEGGEFAVVAEVNKITQEKIILHPLLIGFPYLRSRKNGELLWDTYSDYYQIRLDDIREFSKMKNVALPNDCGPMKDISEAVFKECLHKVLGDSISKDWGGETSDYYSNHVHLGEKRYSCAFLLKGPARFKPMDLNHLGKNNDQIVRLSKEPVDILIVQHSHDITLPVRETLKVFATQPSNPRRYCFVDGRVSLRFLLAYNLLDWALEKSIKK